MAFVAQPVAEAPTPIPAALWRTGLLLLAGEFSLHRSPTSWRAG
jgi:hypothetical protein